MHEALPNHLSTSSDAQRTPATWGSHAPVSRDFGLSQQRVGYPMPEVEGRYGATSVRWPDDT